MSEIPVLDAAGPAFDQPLLDACERIGFAAVTGHGIEPALFDAMRDMTRSLFAIGDDRKRELAITRDDYRGFIPLGFFTPNRAEASGAEHDLYEGFKLHWECPADHPARGEFRLYGSNRRVPELPEMAATIASYWDACDAFAERLLPIFAAALGVEARVLASWHEAPLTNMTLLHYPAQTASSEAVGIHPHKDTNVITFLHPDPVGGLEVRDRDGSWITVEAPADALVINTGEMLELWSGGRFVATPHRVINRSGKERYSFPWFLVPNHAVVVEPLVACAPGFDAVAFTMPVGQLSAEVWRTNWPDAVAADDAFDLGSLR